MVSRIKRFAITGGIACGKSTVAAWLPQWGGLVLDTDALAHELETVGGEAVAPICAAFGSDVLDAEGGVNRAKLGRRVFADPEARAILNAVIHPLIKRRFEQWLESPVPAETRFQAVLIPLLFEVEWDTSDWDAVIAVVCAADEQIRRLQTRGLSEVDARLRIAAQMSCAEKARRADYVIWNTGSMDALYTTANALFRKLLENKS